MRIGTDLIRSLEPSSDIHCGRQTFEYVDVVDFSAKPQIASWSNVLWCSTSSSTQNDQSWYGATFDRSKKLSSISERAGWVILTDDLDDLATWKGGFILVPNVPRLLRALYDHVLATVAPQVVGVTGSVGKTTCVALVEHVLAQYGKTLRIYAKRITPLSLFEIVINRLELEHAYVAMEYSMFYRWHIAELAKLLPPTVGILLNVESEHLGIDGIRDAHDILKAKLRLLDSARFKLVEKELTSKWEALPPVFTFAWQDYITHAGRDLEPFIKSKLSYIQIGAALKAKELLIGDVTEADIRAVESFTPKEHRLQQLTCSGRTFFFDGEITSAARLRALGDSMYTPRALVLHEVQFYGNTEVQKESFRAALACFDVVYISKNLDSEQRGFVESCVDACRSAIFYDEHIPVDAGASTVIAHWGAYWRNESNEMVAVETFERLM